MRIIWASPTGSDTTGNGSRDNPYQTIEKCLADFDSGSQIRLLPGTFTPEDSILIEGKDGSLFAEYPGTVYIQPEKTTKHQAGLAILDANRFSIYGINVLQAADPSGNTIGIYGEDISTFLVYTCAVSDFEIPSGAGHGIFASGLLGRVENCRVSNMACGGGILYGIRTDGINVIDCEVTALSGAGDCELKGILEIGPDIPTPPVPPVPPPPIPPSIWLGGPSVYFWNGTTMATQEATPLHEHNDIYMVTKNDGWAVGYDANGNAPLVSRWNGAIWADIPPAGDMTRFLQSVYGFAASDIWVCGYDGGFGSVHNWTGAWSPDLAVAFNDDFYGLWGHDNIDIWVVGTSILDEGVVYRGNVGGFVEAVFSPIADRSFYSVGGSAANNILVVGEAIIAGSGRIYRWNGIAFIEELNGDVDLGGFDWLNSVWAVDASNIWAVGFNVILYYDGVSWVKQAYPGGFIEFYGVWGTGPNDIYAVGDDWGAHRYLYHWDGTAWSIVYSEASADYYSTVVGTLNS